MEVPFYKPTIEEEEKDCIKRVLELENRYKMSQILERKVCQYINAKHSVSTNNSTASMHLVLSSMGIKRGDKLLVSVNSFPSVAEVIRHFDAEPILVDINEDDFNIDVKQFERTLRMHKHKKLKGAFISHTAGQPADLDPLYEIAKEYKIKIIDDATQAFGATYGGKKIGSTGSYASCFNFSLQSKDTIASGGIFVTESEELAKQAMILRNHAILSNDWDEFGNLGYVYDVKNVGMEYDMPELSAAFNIGQLSHLEEKIKARQAIAAIYDKELQNCPHVSIPVKKRDHIYDKYIIKIDKNRDHFAKKLKEKGIFTALHYVPIHLLEYYKNKYSLKVNDFPVALANYQQILSIPIYVSMSEKEVMYICESIREIAEQRV